MSKSEGDRPGSGRILVVDDEAALRRSVARALSNDGHVTVEAEDGAAALAAIAEAPFDAVLTDISMPHLNGIQLLRAIRESDLDVPVVLLTGLPTVETAMTAIEYGALEYMTKPADLARLRATMRRAVQLGRLARSKRAALAETGGDARGAGDRAGLEAMFERAMSTVWSAFQPLVRVDGTPYGHEALLRSPDPDLPHPGAMLDAAERLGRLDHLGRHMRALSAAPVAAAPECGLLFVNLHPRDLFDPELLNDASPLLAIASRVVLESTERASLDRLGDVKKRGAELRERGFRLAIDDLGAGYAGLTAFATLEPEVAKLDMSLIRDVDKSATKQKLVASMASLCRDLGIVCVAEGIETVSELRAVTEFGCDVVQGYLLAKPGAAFPTVVWPR